MSRADGVLVVVLTRKWFDMIESGEKREEYRGSHWAHRLLHEYVRKQWPRPLWAFAQSDYFPYHTLRAFDGYRKGRRVLEQKIRYIDWGEPLPEWSGDTVKGDCFRIHLWGRE